MAPNRTTKRAKCDGCGMAIKWVSNEERDEYWAHDRPRTGIGFGDDRVRCAGFTAKPTQTESGADIVWFDPPPVDEAALARAQHLEQKVVIQRFDRGIVTYYGPSSRAELEQLAVQMGDVKLLVADDLPRGLRQRLGNGPIVELTYDEHAALS